LSDESFELGDLSELAEGEMRCFPDVDTDGVLVCRVDGDLYAVEDNCSHADQKLSEGRFRRGMITCPKHGAAFDVRDGSHQSPPAYTGVATYEIIGSETGVSVRRRATERGDSGPSAPRMR